MPSLKKPVTQTINPLIKVDEGLLEILFRDAPEAMIILDAKHETVLDCNEKAISLFEAEKQTHIAGQSLYRLIENGPTELVHDLLKMKMQNGGHFTQELSFRTLQHKTFWGSLEANSFDQDNSSYIVLRITKFMDFQDTEEVLPALLKGTARYAGNRYFQELTRLMSKLFRAKYVFIGKFSEDGEQVTIIESFSELKKPFKKQFRIEGTFFENITQGNTLFFPKGVNEMFPDMKYLQENSIEGFMGIPIIGRNSEAIGILGLMTDHAINEFPDMQNIVSLFATRIAEELHQSRSKEILQDQARDLTSSNAVKDKLLSVISNDLLDPLQTIMEFSATLRRNLHKYDQEKITERIEIVDNSIRNICFMLDNLSCWADFYRDSVHVVRDFISANALIRENLAHFRYITEAKELEVITPQDDTLVLYTDKTMISSIIRNVLSNAVKYTRKGGRISIGLKELKSKIKLSIEDNGPGISRVEMERITHADMADPELIQTGNKSAGIGLLLSQSQAQCIGGSLTIDTVKNKGTLVTLTVPR